ncbi:MAG: LysR substrate-binding domain-containing protein [Gluconobacter potus]|uniref:LysR family transcriptional regulator n=1 Tax=Gluconobacter potus TaxID=2724927 RepID=A0ABR9YRH0_9PROT|nr:MULTISPECIES: LysR substrate-binding domain-containing protein [Gluconobacter]MBF0866020.1 LysR family transcriptional regulator [Gluconobacter sp. R71656]MBF0869112.1 LysR family transcriptional regulator [Gluconobacter sp. R75628]MBF0875104.1 LysR family transcriptional regulator [Gluconobacter sp. R75629]MBF0884065.1 LysR family transcriptional regulator [Gluconobacter potus]
MKRSDMPSLDDLRAFAAVVRLGSVRAAATELALTHGAVSRRVSKLADDLKLQLLEPDGRGVRPTRDGSRLAEAATDALKGIAASLTEIRSSSDAQPIVLSCERSLAMRWLIPRLSDFQDRHPGIDVHLSTGGGALDFARDRITLAIRRLDFPLAPDWAVTTLAQEAVGPVMRPDLAQRFADGGYLALGSLTRPEGWKNWLVSRPDMPTPRDVRLYDHHFMMLEAAANGLGVALSPRIIAMDDIATGRLLAPAGFDTDGTLYGLIRPGGLEMTDNVRALEKWVVKQVP